MLWLAVISYALRAVYQLGFGNFHFFIKGWFGRYVSYDIVSPLYDIPTILFIYIAHYRNFKPQPPVGRETESTELIEDSMSIISSEDPDESERTIKDDMRFADLMSDLEFL